MEHTSGHLLGITKKVLELDPVLSVSTLAVFVYVAAHPECAAADIVKDLGIAQPAVTRHLQRLGRGSPGASAAVGRGLELVSWHDDPQDSRRRLYTLSSAGASFLATLG